MVGEFLLTMATESLFVAIRTGKIRTVSNLIEAGGNVSERDQNGRTLLMQAVFVQKDDVRTHIVRMLLGKGCNVNAQDVDGQTALMFAAFEPNKNDVVRRIVSTGKCDPNIQDRKGDCALIHAVYGGNSSVIRILVNSAHTKAIIDVNAANKDGINPLILAFKLQQTECCKVLVEEGYAKTSVIKDKNGLHNILRSATVSVMRGSPLGHGRPEPRYLGHANSNTRSAFDAIIRTTSPQHGNDTDSFEFHNRTERKSLKKKKSKIVLHEEGDEDFEDAPPGLLVVNPTAATNSRSSTFSPVGFSAVTSTSHLPLKDAALLAREDSTVSYYSKRQRLTPLTAVRSDGPLTPRIPCASPPRSPTANGATSALWWNTSDEVESISSSRSQSSNIEGLSKGKIRREMETKARLLSPLRSGTLQRTAHFPDDRKKQPKGGLLPAIRTTSGNISLIGSRDVYKNLNF